MSDKPTVVITGGLGFIGAQVSKTFASAGYDVIIIDTNTSRNGRRRCYFISTNSWLQLQQAF